MERYNKLANHLRRRCPQLELRVDEPLSRHTSFHIGGPVRLMAFPGSEEELVQCVGLCREMDARCIVMGNGSNLLCPDGILDAFAVNTALLNQIDLISPTRIFAGAGSLLSRLAVFAADHALEGLVFAHGIPGTLGGAVVMNAGAYDGEMAQVVAETRFLTSSGEVHTVANKDHQFTYRSSRFSQTQDVILSCELELRPGSTELLRTQMQELSLRRRSSQPLEWPSGGSVFKRPQGHYAAALIDQCGLKGLSVGGAQVSEKHAGFIINKGGATQADVLELVDQVRQRVLKDTGVELELELKVL